MLIIFIVASHLVFTKCDLPHTLISVWALWGVGRNNLESSQSDASDAVVVGHTAYVCLLIIIAVYFSGM